jgi:hypothetical protein
MGPLSLRALSLSHSSFCLATKDGFSPFAKGESTLSKRLHVKTENEVKSG